VGDGLPVAVIAVRDQQCSGVPVEGGLPVVAQFGFLYHQAKPVVGDAGSDVQHLAVGVEAGPAQGAELAASCASGDRCPGDDAQHRVWLVPGVGEDAGDVCGVWRLWSGLRFTRWIGRAVGLLVVQCQRMADR
jgi:hypothetical protein